MVDPKDAGKKFQELVDILAKLRGENGCPWDKDQDERSILNFFLEEVYEAVDALARNDAHGVTEELGDVLMEVVFLARIFEEKSEFSICDALDSINRKMIRRHPHVFGDKKFASAKRVLEAWIEQKKEEKKRSSHFEGISSQAPALLAAFEIGQRVSHFSFDWTSAVEALQKVKEEIGELEEAVTTGRKEEVEAEIGDIFFALANVARKLGFNPETALRQANDKFIQRFTMLEARLIAQGKELGRVSLSEMDSVWDEIKKQKR